MSDCLLYADKSGYRDVRTFLVSVSRADGFPAMLMAVMFGVSVVICL